jgi:hypothetical protein
MDVENKIQKDNYDSAQVLFLSFAALGIEEIIELKHFTCLCFMVNSLGSSFFMCIFTPSATPQI